MGVFVIQVYCIAQFLYLAMVSACCNFTTEIKNEKFNTLYGSTENNNKQATKSR